MALTANQPPPLQDYDLAGSDPLLVPVLESAATDTTELRSFGLRLTQPEVLHWGDQANRHPPELFTHDRFGNRLDRVEFHPSWHQLLGQAVAQGMHSLPWEPASGPDGHRRRTALTFLASQIEAGHFCPISMTFASIPALRRQPDLAKEWEPLILTRAYDPRFRPAPDKHGVLIGMGMTERQGGSDVRVNLTRAEPTADGYVVNGHKWFTSAPMNDAFLILAQAPEGLSCFLLPRFRPDGTVNGFHLQRLKDKLGNRSNASAEVEFIDAYARLVGEEGRGVPTIIEMVNGTRLDCVTGSAALMRQAVSQAIHHCEYRHAFGAPLIKQPAMANVLADLEVEVEAAVALMVRLAIAFDGARDNDYEESLLRIGLPLAKYWVTKRCSQVVGEALECVGGNGFVEESVMPRLFRESPLNAIWEGSGNVIALDVLRALSRHPEALSVLAEEIRLGAEEPALAAFADKALGAAGSLSAPEAEARYLTERLALAWQGSLLARWAAPEVAGAFLRSRITPGGRLFGTLPASTNFDRIITPAVPHV
ncbi:MAG TPA: acyl-CoA dehydrogenase family protein [Acidimicrobiia bacterium]|nr:acyl-CoA dehydrogenase family protein [Acidimicrobiia bacterium]